MVNRKTNDPLNYLGVRASNPPNMVREQRSPLTTDTTGPDGPFVLGDLWLDLVGEELYIITNSGGGVATWKAFSL